MASKKDESPRAPAPAGSAGQSAGQQQGLDGTATNGTVGPALTRRGTPRKRRLYRPRRDRGRFRMSRRFLPLIGIKSGCLEWCLL